ncbi:hypothetical protein C8R44DRAFT_868908 [Mycena epipterygia]|nr:hypothetical protein C8R44DRAFT_868908 [Mycena epipterygia]
MDSEATSAFPCRAADVDRMIAAISQGFFLYRCWKITIVIAGVLGMLVSFIAGVVSSIGLIACPYYTQHMAISTAGDEDRIPKHGTPAMALYLRCRSSRYPVMQEKTLSKIVRPSFETAALTSMVALVDCILYISQRIVPSPSFA